MSYLKMLHLADIFASEICLLMPSEILVSHAFHIVLHQQQSIPNIFIYQSLIG